MNISCTFFLGMLICTSGVSVWALSSRCSRTLESSHCHQRCNSTNVPLDILVRSRECANICISSHRRCKRVANELEEANELAPHKWSRCFSSEGSTTWNMFPPPFKRADLGSSCDPCVLGIPMNRGMRPQFVVRIQAVSKNLEWIPILPIPTSPSSHTPLAADSVSISSFTDDTHHRCCRMHLQQKRMHEHTQQFQLYPISSASLPLTHTHILALPLYKTQCTLPHHLGCSNGC